VEASDVTFHFGKEMKKRRLAKGWSKEEFAELYAKALGKPEPLNVKAIEALERSEVGPVSPNRREIIAFLLDMPLAGMLLNETSIFVPNIQTRKRLDIDESMEALKKYWEQHLKSTSAHLLDEIDDRIIDIEKEIPYAINMQDRRVLQEILYKYHIVISCILDGEYEHDKAISHLTKAIVLSRKLKDETLESAALYRLGNIYLVAGRIDNATTTYSQALHLARDTQVNGALLLKRGLADSVLAGRTKENRDRLNAQVVQTIENGGEIAKQKFDYDEHFLKLNKERYHLDKAAALINIGYYQEAINEIFAIRQESNSECRNAYSTMLLGKAYFGLNNYTLAASMALDSLPVFKRIHSKVNVYRIARLYRELKESPAANKVEVAELGLELWKYDPKLVRR